jgi:hypothetical protein
MPVDVSAILRLPSACAPLPLRWESSERHRCRSCWIRGVLVGAEQLVYVVMVMKFGDDRNDVLLKDNKVGFCTALSRVLSMVTRAS